MKLILAPMEGVVDYQMRDFLTSIGGFDMCVTEFVRVTDRLLPARVFSRYCPELVHGGRTQAGVPVRIQLLGQEPTVVAENAALALSLGSFGVDLNFGCPAKAVNKSKGGAVLLKEPESIYQIVSATKRASGEHLVSAKVRLGYDDDTNSQEIIDAVVQAKADTIVIHARTKRDGYRPPAYWEKIPPLVENKSIEVVANGEVWSVADHTKCVEQSRTANVMLGRGALATPDLARQIKASLNGEIAAPFSWQDVLEHILNANMYQEEGNNPSYFSSRTKQWLAYLKLAYPEAQLLFDQIRKLHATNDVLSVIKANLIQMRKS